MPLMIKRMLFSAESLSSCDHRKHDQNIDSLATTLDCNVYQFILGDLLDRISFQVGWDQIIAYWKQIAASFIINTSHNTQLIIPFGLN